MPYTGNDFDFELDDRLKQLRTIYRQFKFKMDVGGSSISVSEKPQSNNFEEPNYVKMTSEEDIEPKHPNESEEFKCDKVSGNLDRNNNSFSNIFYYLVRNQNQFNGLRLFFVNSNFT